TRQPGESLILHVREIKKAKKPKKMPGLSIICRLAKDKRPRLLLLENVKGLLSHDHGRTFHTIIRSLDELGYDLQWQVLNSKNYQVPQNREWVYIVGHLRGTRRPQVPLRERPAVCVSPLKSAEQEIAPSICASN